MDKNLTKDFMNIVQPSTDNNQSGQWMVCPSRCTSKNHTNIWSNCIQPLYLVKEMPHCYRSLQFKQLTCGQSTHSCQRLTSLHKTSDLGQWSTWSSYSKQCQPDCTGTKTKIRFCYFNGSLANGLCLGGELDSNQTDTERCSPMDCISGSKNNGDNSVFDNRVWNYTFYTSIVIFFITLLLILAWILRGQYRRRKRNDQVPPEQPSTSFLFAENMVHRHQPTNPNRLGSNPSNVIQQGPTLLSPWANPPTPLSPPSQLFRKKMIESRKLPSLPRPRTSSSTQYPGSVVKRIKSRSQSRHMVPQDTLVPPTTVDAQDFVSQYTRMESFVTPTVLKPPLNAVTKSVSFDATRQYQVRPKPKAKPQVITQSYTFNNGNRRRRPSVSSQRKRASLTRVRKVYSKTCASHQGGFPSNRHVNKTLAAERTLAPGLPITGSDGYLVPNNHVNNQQEIKPRTDSHSYETFQIKDEGNTDLYVSMGQ